MAQTRSTGATPAKRLDSEVIVPLGVLRGREEIAGLFRDLFAALPDLDTTVTRAVAGEHEAAVEWRMSGHFTGQAFQIGLMPTQGSAPERAMKGAFNAATNLRRAVAARTSGR